jgi:hypothetical protein
MLSHLAADQVSNGLRERSAAKRFREDIKFAPVLLREADHQALRYLLHVFSHCLASWCVFWCGAVTMPADQKDAPATNCGAARGARRSAGKAAPPQQRPSLRHRHSISINISAMLDASTRSAAVVTIIISA